MPRGKAKPDYKTNGNNNITDVIKELWQAAVKRVLARRGIRKEDLEPLLGLVLVQAESLYADWPLTAFAEVDEGN